MTDERITASAGVCSPLLNDLGYKGSPIRDTLKEMSLEEYVSRLLAELGMSLGPIEFKLDD